MSGNSPTLKPYGAWHSAVSAEALADAQIGFADLQSVAGRLYWTQNVPAAGGAIQVFSLQTAVALPVVPETANVRTRVHEYGGAPYLAVGSTLFYCQFSDQRLYRLDPGGQPEPLTPPGYRYADFIPQGTDGSTAEALICVREDHRDPRLVRNEIVRIALPAGGPGEVLYGESDFVAFPRLSPNGTQLAFIAWNHPNMPWDGTELKVAALTDEGLGAIRDIAGGPSESVLDPQWDADGTLYFVSDHSGFWNLYSWRLEVRTIWPRDAEFARPLWQLGQSNYALMGDGRAIVRICEAGFDRLAIVDLSSGSGRLLDLPYVEYSQLIRLDGQRAAMIAKSALAAQSIVSVNANDGSTAVIHSTARALLAPNAVSTAIPIEFPSANGRTAHAFFYAPTNPEFRAPVAELPPLLTFVHGGPTTQASPAFSSAVQFWTSRGFAVVDVNYGGSSGYGRAYREALNGNWGLVDAEDVIAAAEYLVRSGRADPKRTAIRGGSAGGFTVLLTLSTSDVFRAGADYFGISDMTALAKDTHKFESRYLDSLIGPLPQAQAIYDRRSPLNHLEGFRAPLIVFQGADDPVVPPSQSERIVDALRARKAPVAYILYPGEGHGFRKPANIIRSVQAELSFYGQVFGFAPADDLPQLQIENHASKK